MLLQGSLGYSSSLALVAPSSFLPVPFVLRLISAMAASTARPKMRSQEADRIIHHDQWKYHFSLEVID